MVFNAEVFIFAFKLSAKRFCIPSSSIKDKFFKYDLNFSILPIYERLQTYPVIALSYLPSMSNSGAFHEILNVLDFKKPSASRSNISKTGLDGGTISLS